MLVDGIQQESNTSKRTALFVDIIILVQMYSLFNVLWHTNTYVAEIVSVLFNFCDVSAPKPSEQSYMKRLDEDEQKYPK